jgi:hypothetical protein
MPTHALFFWGFHNGATTFHLTWNQIFHNSIVVITASEGKPLSSEGAVRFVGDARFTVNNIAPFDGGVDFRVTIEWDDPLDLWTSVTVFDRSDPTLFGSVPIN